MGCGPLLRRKPDCTSVAANVHRSRPAFRTPSGPIARRKTGVFRRPMGPPSPLRGEGGDSPTAFNSKTCVNLVESSPRVTAWENDSPRSKTASASANIASHTGLTRRRGLCRYSARPLRTGAFRNYGNSRGGPNTRWRQLHGLILRSDAQHRVSKDGPVRSLVGALWSVLRDAALCAAPQDEGGLGVGETVAVATSRPAEPRPGANRPRLAGREQP
jgi:hypothetical protein